MATTKRRAPQKPVKEDVFTDEPMRLQQVTHGTVEDALARTRDALKRATAGERLAPTKVLSFEDPQAFTELLTPKRYEVFIAVRKYKSFDSIQALSVVVKRDRAGVSRDVNALVKAGLLRITRKVFPGHGMRNAITPAAECLELHVRV
jgi:predicted transcriptional regulator